MQCKICGNIEKTEACFHSLCFGFDGQCRYNFSDITVEKFNEALDKRKKQHKKNPNKEAMYKILMHGFLK